MDREARRHQILSFLLCKKREQGFYNSEGPDTLRFFKPVYAAPVWGPEQGFQLKARVFLRRAGGGCRRQPWMGGKPIFYLYAWRRLMHSEFVLLTLQVLPV